MQQNCNRRKHPEINVYLYQFMNIFYKETVNIATCKENGIYIRVEFTRKKCKTAIFLYCFHTAGVLHIFVLYNLLGPGTSFYRKSKIILKENQIMKWAGFIIDQWSFHIDSMPFTLQTMIFRYNYKSNDGFYSPNSL